MRFIYILIVSFLLSSSLWGQKTFASRAMDYHWMFTRFVWTDITGRYTGFIDTSEYRFNGKGYQTFKGEGLNFQVADSGSKVFGLKGSQEYLLMDYSLNRGDTLVCYFFTNPYKLRVTSKVKVKIENDSLWRMELKSFSNSSNVRSLIWLESIGCLNAFHPINWPMMFGAADIMYNLDCVIHSDTNVLKSIGKNCVIANSLVDSKNIWHTWASNNNGDLKFSDQYYFTGLDTIIHNKKYKMMNQPMRFVRYDSLEKKYFVLANYNNGQELLVYSDKVKVGDTMAIIQGTVPDTVTKIEYKWIGEEYRKVITTGRDIYISGIGSVNRVMWNNHLATFPEFASGNICFEESSTIRYHYPFFFQNKEQCEITSSIQNASINAISFFPNPVQTNLNFNTSDRKEFKIGNSLGVLILEGECEDKIDLAALSKGIYFIEIQSKNQTSHFKFLKE
jgi:hypothetical protein